MHRTNWCGCQRLSKPCARISWKHWSRRRGQIRTLDPTDRNRGHSYQQGYTAAMMVEKSRMLGLPLLGLVGLQRERGVQVGADVGDGTLDAFARLGNPAALPPVGASRSAPGQ